MRLDGLVAEVRHWAAGLEEVHRRIPGGFARAELRARVLADLRGLLGQSERRNGWTQAEAAGEVCPDGMQRLLRTTDWNADAVRDGLDGYMLERARRRRARAVEDLVESDRGEVAQMLVLRAPRRVRAADLSSGGPGPADVRSVRARLISAAVVAVLLAAGCAEGQDPQTEAPATVGAPQSSTAAPGPEAPEDAHWSYEGETGPENWAELEADFATCGTGTRQSPINLTEVEAEPAQGAELTYVYEPATYELTNPGHTVLAEAEDAGGITIGGEDYQLVQFHAHVPSEHALNGKREELEVHLVHQSEEGQLAVVGVLVQQGPAGTGLAEAWKDLPTQGENVTLTDFDASALLPQDRTTFRYEGSLTTPPCTEGVQWLVMQDTVTAPAEAVAAFEKLVGDTARPLQPLNGRDPLIG